MKAGDIVCWTVFSGVNCKDRPVWARILGVTGVKGAGSMYGVVRVLAAGKARATRVGHEFETNLRGWGPRSAVCTVMSEDEVPDEAWAQIALEQLTGNEVTP